MMCPSILCYFCLQSYIALKVQLQGNILMKNSDILLSLLTKNHKSTINNHIDINSWFSWNEWLEMGAELLYAS